MSRNLHLGAASISFSQPLYIESAASIVSQKEADGPLGDFFDLICKDPVWLRNLGICGKYPAERNCHSGHEQSRTGLRRYPPDVCRRSSCPDCSYLLWFRRAWNSFLRTLRRLLHHGGILVSRLPALTAGFGTRVLCATSSHFASAEKEFLFPLGYGNSGPFLPPGR